MQKVTINYALTKEGLLQIDLPPRFWSMTIEELAESQDFSELANRAVNEEGQLEILHIDAPTR